MKEETKLVDSKTGENQLKKRQTVITKSISRTIQTAQYFSLTINHTAQDTIEWETLEERDKKQSNLTKIAIKDFMQTHDTVLDQLKLGQMHVFKTDHVAKKAANKSPEIIGLDDLEELEVK